MSIILQNYNNLINKLIKDYFSNKIDRIIDNFDLFSINNYINLISSFDECMNDFIKCAFVILIRELDKKSMNSIERKKKYHIKCKTIPQQEQENSLMDIVLDIQ